MSSQSITALPPAALSPDVAQNPQTARLLKDSCRQRSDHNSSTPEFHSFVIRGPSWMTSSLSFLFCKVTTPSKAVRIQGDNVFGMGCQQLSSSRGSIWSLGRSSSLAHTSASCRPPGNVRQRGAVEKAWVWVTNEVIRQSTRGATGLKSRQRDSGLPWSGLGAQAVSAGWWQGLGAPQDKAWLS